MTGSDDATSETLSLILQVREMMSEFSTRLTVFTDGSNRLSSKLDEIAEKTKSYSEISSQKLADLHHAHAELRVTVMDKLDRMQGSIDLIKEDINVNFASSNTAISNTRNSRVDIENMSDLILAMQRQYKILSAQVEELRKDQTDRSAHPKN